MERILQVKTAKLYEAVDITDQIEGMIEEGEEGFLFVMAPHTSAALLMGMNIPAAIADNERVARTMFACARPYLHAGKDGPNAEGHMYSWLHGNEMILPIEKGKLKLGKLQRIFFVETSGPRNRKVRVFNIK